MSGPATPFNEASVGRLTGFLQEVSFREHLGRGFPDRRLSLIYSFNLLTVDFVDAVSLHTANHSEKVKS